MPADVIDTPALREFFGPTGPWAVECGDRARKYRERMDKPVSWLARGVDVSTQTIYMIEAGQIIPKDYLRSAIAFCLGQDVDTIWPPLTRRRVGEIGQVA